MSGVVKGRGSGPVVCCRQSGKTTTCFGRARAREGAPEASDVSPSNDARRALPLSRTDGAYNRCRDSCGTIDQPPNASETGSPAVPFAWRLAPLCRAASACRHAPRDPRSRRRRESGGGAAEARRAARRLLAPRTLTPRQQQRLRRLSRSAKASEITRTLQAWRFHLSDVTVRRLQRDSHIFHFTWR